MTITQQQLHTLRLLREEPARRIYRPHYPDDYSWVHKDAQKPVTGTLHRLFSRGYATVTPNDRNMAVLTEKGRAVVAALGSR
jgi:DNA-binding MarR family transcriptional regulator